MRILITGPQGSGKTTQAKLLSEYLEVPLIDSGDMLREWAKQDSEDGRSIKAALDQGTMAPNEIVGKIVEERVNREDCQKGFVLDGYPRTLDQMKVFDPKLDQVFYLAISDEEVKKRMMERGRADDTPELIAERLMLYHQLTEPVLDFYKEILVKVDGHGKIEDIQGEIRNHLNG